MIRSSCQHDATKKHGRDKSGNQRHKCLLCGKTWSDAKPRILGNSRLPVDRAVMCLRMLLEGTSIRATSRLTGTDKNAIIGLVVTIGERCERFLRSRLRGLNVDDIQCDEMWGFVGMKERTRKRLGRGESVGDCYCFTAIERRSKLLVTWHAGKREPSHTFEFIRKLDVATAGRFQLSTDGFRPYKAAVPTILGNRVDFGVVIKAYTTVGVTEQRRYSPPTVTSCERDARIGDPTIENISTSHVERCNLSMRMGIRRLTRLTNGHSKKWENHEAALALWFAYYNFCRSHMTLKTTPAVAAGLASRPWTVLELLQAVATS